MAESASGAEPWVDVSQVEAGAACAAAGKRLCTEGEWRAACNGEDQGRVYPYGPTYDSQACNGVDLDLGVLDRTGSLPACEGGFPGLYDMSGNAWEWTSSCAGDACRTRGGSYGFNFGDQSLRCDTSYDFVPDLHLGSIGFRCCQDASAAVRPTMIFSVDVPADTPADMTVFIQSGHTCVLPLERVAALEWQGRFTREQLYACDFDGQLHYAYTHGQGFEGGEFFDDDPGADDWAVHRSAVWASGGRQHDRVSRWRFWPADGTTLPTYDATLDDFVPREGGVAFQAGQAPYDFWWSDLARLLRATDAAVASSHGNSVMLSQFWSYRTLDPLPVLVNVPDQVPQYTDEALHMHLRVVVGDGLNTTLLLAIDSPPGPTEGRSAEWWSAWFAQVRRFVLHHLEIAAAEGVDAVVLAGWGLDVGLPGTPGAPADAATRWRALLTDAHAAFPGQLGMGLLLFGALSYGGLPSYWDGVKPFADQLDFLAVSLWQPLAADGLATQDDLEAETEAVFAASLDSLHAASGLPIVLGPVAYASYDGAATNAHGVYEVGLSTFGPEADVTLTYDAVEQAMIYQALMKAIAGRPYLVGIYPFNYAYAPAPSAPDYSVTGKPAEAVLSAWYAHALP